MNLLRKEQIKQLILEAEGLEIQEESDKGINVYDEIDDRFLEYRYLEDLDVKELFQFNSLPVNKESFFKVVEESLDKHMFMTLDKIVFINNKEEYDKLIEEYPEQHMDMENAVGINFFHDNVLVINAYLISKTVNEMLFLNSTFEEEFTIGLWETLIHELRHSVTDNPIIPEEMIAIEEGKEENVEIYCQETFNNVIRKHPDYLCFDKQEIRIVS